MADSSPDRLPEWPVVVQGVLLGAAIGILAMVGGGVFLRDAQGLLAASSGVVVTVAAALAVGLWAGAPGAAEGDIPLRARWFSAGLITGVAGVVATLTLAYPALGGGALAQAIALLVLVAAPVYALGLLVPALLAWAEEREDRDAGEDVSRWGPAGTLAVSVLAGLGLGAALAGVALVPLLGPGPVLLGTGALLILPTLLSDAVAPPTEERLLFESETPIGMVRVVEIVYPGQRQPERRLYVNDEEESGELVRSGAPTLPYIAAAEEWLAQTAQRGDRYLFLGGGAYTLPRRVAERDPRARITVVELDMEVTRVAFRFFGMRRGYGIRAVHGDARAFVERAESGGYEHVYVDVYGGTESLPYSLVTREAFEHMASLLAPGGMLTLNAIGVTEGRGARRFWSLVRTVADVFPSVAVYVHLGRDFPERQNVLVAAVLSPEHSFPESAGMFEAWPRDEWPDDPPPVVLRDLFPEELPRPPESAETTKRAAGE